MQDLGYYNGTIAPIGEIMVPMNDRVCWFGDGVYDAGPCRNGNIFALDEHIDRFFRSAAMLDMEMPMGKGELRELLCELVRKVDSRDLFVYYQLTRGTAPRSHDYDPGPGNLWVMIRPAVQNFKMDLKLVTAEDTRYFHCNIKTLNLIPNIMASQRAKIEGCQEAVFYRPGGRVTECSHSNIHILKNGELWTAPTDELILPGIARAHLIRMCEKLGVAVHEEPFTLEELFAAEEVLVTSSSKLVAFASEIDHKPVGGKHIALRERIRDALVEEYMSATE